MNLSNLLSLSTEQMAANMAGLVVCSIIMFVCVCRLNFSPARPLRLSLSQVMHISFAFWAAGTFVDLWRGHLIGFHGAAGGFGICLYLFLSYREAVTRAYLLRSREAMLREAWNEPAYQEDSHAYPCH